MRLSERAWQALEVLKRGSHIPLAEEPYKELARSKLATSKRDTRTGKKIYSLREGALEQLERDLAEERERIAAYNAGAPVESASHAQPMPTIEKKGHTQPPLFDEV